MNIILEDIGRRFNREWIFRRINYSFTRGESYAVLGPNGSGKSTLLQIIAGSLSPSEGKVSYSLPEGSIHADEIFKYLSIAAPYLELIEEFTLSELINFHFNFKAYRQNFDKEAVINLLGFEKSKDKLIKHFSSGMKQRTKLALAFCADTPLLMLDEPASNLDSNGISWYLKLVEEFGKDRTLIICSNQEFEYSFCRKHIHISNYKSF